MSYNLIRNGILRSLTASGTGNVSLNWQELEYLVDEETQYTPSSTPVTISGGDILYLEADLSNRIKIDGIHLYMTSTTASGTVLSDYLEFYYKNNTSDSYSLCSKALEAQYYSATITSPSAPRYVLCTISGIDASIYEFEILNNDQIISYGTDGQLYAEHLENTPVGSEGDAQAIAIFNNSTGSIAADAYTCIDYTGSIADEYIKIASSANGTYYFITDGALIEDNLLTSDYRWDHGSHENTQVSANTVVPTSSSGTYTTPIMVLSNVYNASYFTVQGIAVSGTGSISYDENVYNGTIRVRNSNTKPMPVYESYLTYTETADIHAVIWSSYDNTYTDREPWTYDKNTSPEAIAVDQKDGRYAISWGYGFYHSHADAYIKVWNRNGTQLYNLSSSVDYEYMFNDQFQFEGEHGLWGYGNYNIAVSRILYHLDEDLSILGSYSESQTDFLYDLATESNGRGCWYTNSIDNSLVHMNTDCTKLKTIYLNSPRHVARTTDGGIWVHDSTLNKVIRYNWSGSKISEFTLPETAVYGTADLTRMSEDFNDGFWYRHGDMIRHVTSGGTVDIGPVSVTDSNRLKGCQEGCFVHSSDDNKMYWVNMNGQIERTRAMPGGESVLIDIFYHTYEESIANNSQIIPVSYDPVWGTDGTAAWNEVRKDGYFLPKVRYHQVKITLRDTSVLQKLIMAPAIKTQDIMPQSSQYIYIKADIPEGADITDYNARLKTWFGVID